MKKQIIKANEAIKKGKYDEAIIIYKNILLNNNDIPEIHFNLGIIFKILNGKKIYYSIDKKGYRSN